MFTHQTADHERKESLARVKRFYIFPVLEIIIERGKRLNRVVPSFVEIILAFDTNI